MKFFSKKENRVAPLPLNVPKINNFVGNEVTKYAMVRGDTAILLQLADHKNASGELPMLYDNAKVAFGAARKQYPGLALTLFEIQMHPSEANLQFKNVIKYLVQHSTKITSFSQSCNKFENGKVEFNAEINQPDLKGNKPHK